MKLGASRVLIVDADADSRVVYRLLLQHHGFEVEDVADGEAAIARLGVWHADVVLTELTLGRLDGHALLKRLKAGERTRGTAVVVLTARGLESDRVRAEAAGCARFLTKPVEPRELVRVIESIIELPQADV